MFVFKRGVLALLLTDLHGRTRVLEKILASAGAFDLVVFSGDLTDFGDAKKTQEIVGVLKKTGKHIFAVPGNCDPPEVLGVLEKEGASIHGKKKELGGFVFTGFGGSNPTPFDTPFEVPDEELAAGMGSACGESGTKNLVFITHAPPKNTICDRLPGGACVGSEAVRKAIERYNPVFLFCGHIHEGIGTELVEKTIVANPGPALAGHYGLANLDKKKVELRALGAVP